jgi:SAM-dependent methyltransferase
MLLDILFWLAVIIVACFGFVVFFGAPFLPTLRPQIITALNLLNLKPGQTMLELGCGDGRVLIAAAERGIHVVGYELNPLLAAVAWLRTRRYGRQVQVVFGDYWRLKWPRTDAIFGFIMPRYMSKLHKKVVQYPARPLLLASFAFPIPEKKPTRVERGVYLYTYR